MTSVYDKENNAFSFGISVSTKTVQNPNAKNKLITRTITLRDDVWAVFVFAAWGMDGIIVVFQFFPYAVIWRLLRNYRGVAAAPGHTDFATAS
jgi:hypothetical protein